MRVLHTAVLVLCLILCWSSTTLAQGHHYGLTAGWQVAGIVSPPEPDALTLFSAYGANNFHAGGWGEVRLYRNLHLRMEAHFATANVSGAVVIRESDGTLGYERTRVHEQSLRFPLLFNYYASDQASAFLGASLVLVTRSETKHLELPTALPYRENRSDFDLAITTGLNVNLHPRVSATAWIARHLNHYYIERPDAFFSPRLVTIGLSLSFRLSQLVKSEE